MKVLLHGDHYNKYWLFKCENCGCIFEAQYQEVGISYFHVDDSSVVKEVRCSCPDCNFYTLTEQPDGYLKEDEPHV